MRICSGAGCLRAVADDVRMCAECQPPIRPVDDSKQHSVTDRVRYAYLYSSPRWQRVRKQALVACPFCARCETAVTELVDHIVPAGVAVAQAQQSGQYLLDKWAGFFLLSNLQGLCRACHWIKTEEDKAHTGAWPDVVEKEKRRPKRRFTFG